LLKTIQVEILHYLGDRRIDNSNRDVLVTKAKDGSLVVAVWNLVNPDSTGSPRTVRLDFKGVNPDATASIARVDEQHSDTLNLYDKMGKPRYPTQAQIQQLDRGSRLKSPEERHLKNGAWNCRCP